MRIAVTGGAGYIGSHTCVVLLGAGHDVLIIDDFRNSERTVPNRIARVAGRQTGVAAVDITDGPALHNALEGFAPHAVIHFAGLKAVAEAVCQPLDYYRINVGGSIALFERMARVGCDRLVFSSSATVYGEPIAVPIAEQHPLAPTNPYGQTKRMVEQIIEDWGQSRPTLSCVNLRYFNPVGAHPSGEIGEAPRGQPNNLVPYLADVAAGRRDRLSVFGDDYETPDGTGVRDYVHVMDLAEAHLAALEVTGRGPGVEAINVGTGRGYSVLEIVRAFEAASGRQVPYEVVPRRDGDVAASVADPSRARDRMDWQARRGLQEMCEDAWRWRKGMSG